MSPRLSARLRAALIVLALAIAGVFAAIAGDLGDGGDPPATTVDTSPVTTVPSVTTAPATTSPNTTVAPDTSVDTTVPETTAPPTTAAPTTLPPTTSTSTTTTLPPTTTTLPPSEPFDPENFLNGTIGQNIPESTAHEPTGNFRVLCEVSHLAYDDPIVYPGQPGASHLHMFFGNDAVNAHSTYESLLNTGGGTCQGGPINRSGYWAPALLTDAGQAVMPDYINVYYKINGPPVSVIEATQLLPEGLRMLAGHNMATGQGGGEWVCEDGSGGKTSTIHSCPGGVRVGVTLVFPACWNGVDLDSADHRSHMRNYVTNPNTGQRECPGSHPVVLPQYEVKIWWNVTGTSGLHLSSDMSAAPGSTFHADWFGAWHRDVLATWTQECVVEMRNCDGGEIGDGRSLSGAPNYTGPRLVDPPS